MCRARGGAAAECGGVFRVLFSAFGPVTRPAPRRRPRRARVGWGPLLLVGICSASRMRFAREGDYRGYRISLVIIFSDRGVRGSGGAGGHRPRRRASNISRLFGFGQIWLVATCFSLDFTEIFPQGKGRNTYTASSSGTDDVASNVEERRCECRNSRCLGRVPAKRCMWR